MMDFIIEVFESIAEVFVDIWLNKIAGKFRKRKRKTEESDEDGKQKEETP